MWSLEVMVSCQLDLFHLDVGRFVQASDYSSHGRRRCTRVKAVPEGGPVGPDPPLYNSNLNLTLTPTTILP